MLSHEQLKFWQTLSSNKQDGFNTLNEEETKQEIKRLMYNKKVWDDSILISGGSSYYTLESLPSRLKGKVYRVAMTYKGNFTEEEHTKKLKYKIKTASGDIFSVAAKSQSDAQAVVDSIFGKGHYRVSEQLV